MSEFTSIHVTGSDWRELCDRLLARLGEDQRGQLAFLYIADEVAADSDRIVDYLRNHSEVAHWVGCVGMGLCSNGLETYDEAALAALFTPFTDDDFRILPGLDDDPAEWLTATAAWRAQSLASVAIVHGDPGAADLPAQLMALSEGLEGGFLLGGVASASNLPVRIADRSVSAGLSGVLFNGTVAISTGLTQGCSLIGERHRVTRSQRNVIETIDDRPALDVFKESIGEELATDLHQVGGLIFVALPVSGSDTGDYLVRNLVGLDPERGLVAIGDLVEPGMEVQFARRDPDTARTDLARMIEHLKGRLERPARGGLYFSCLGRGRNQFGDDSAEMALVQELLGDVPLAGFYANGEISHNRLYGYTGVLTLFS